MSKLVEYRERINAAGKRLKELTEVSERSTEQEAEIDRLLAEVNDLGPKMQRELELDAATRQYGTPEPASTRKSGMQPVDGNGKPADEQRSEQVDRRSMAERFIDSPAVKEYRGKGRGDAFSVGSFHARHAAQNAANGQEIDRRALVYTGALPADFIQPQYVPGIFRGDDLQGTIRDVLINGTTTSDALTFFRELAFTNSAAAVAQATATTGATGLKPESAITFEQATANVVTIAHWIPITRQTLEDAAQLRTYVEQRLLDGLRLEESDQLLNGDGTGANMTGLTNTSGVQALDQTYFTANPVNNATFDNENFERILRAKRLIRTTGRARANFVVLNPADAETILTAVDADRQYFGPGPFSAGVTTNLWGMRVVEDENQTAGEAVVGDGRMAAVWDRMQAQILIDTIDDQFVRNMLTILAEERIALTVFRPAAFALVDLA
jgi:HK97 family phage major capsid protein